PGEPHPVPARLLRRGTHDLRDGLHARHDHRDGSLMRVTQQTLARQTLYDLSSATDRLAKIQQQLSPGKQIGQPKDDPFGASRPLALRDELADTQQYQRNINEGDAWLKQTDSALNNANDIVTRIRTLVVQAGNGTQDDGGLQAIAAEVSQLKESLREQANTTL